MPTATIGPVRLRYTVEGAGPPVLLLMGFGFGLEGWRPQLSDLRADHTVCAFDNRGVGGSDAPPPPYTTAAMAGDALGLMDHLGWPRAHIVGLSMGGMIAQHLALRAPQRVASLSLLSTHAGGWAARPTLALLENLRQQHATREERLRASIALNCSPAYVQRVGFEAILAKLDGIPASGGPGLIGQASAALTHYTRHRLRSLRSLPALVVCGRHDQVVRPVNARILGALLGVEPVVLPGGHALNAECSAAINRLLRQRFVVPAPDAYSTSGQVSGGGSSSSSGRPSSQLR